MLSVVVGSTTGRRVQDGGDNPDDMSSSASPWSSCKPTDRMDPASDSLDGGGGGALTGGGEMGLD